MRKVLIIVLVVLLLVSFVALPVSAKGGGNWTGAQGGKWTNATPKPGWSQVSRGEGGSGIPGLGPQALRVVTR